ncbi:hypothetical protein [Bradyrhizobium japonicum]|uniref:hypothetical protein n=1 Tax=Bradyrhizobium japonicum TaxID=375 RepID=UPI000576ED4A|nr:hypothetical protein [Bradyrhizobium japonicum]
MVDFHGSGNLQHGLVQEAFCSGLFNRKTTDIDQNADIVGGVGYGEARLTVRDNGRGIQHPNETGSGLQIGGTVNQTSSDAGTTTTLTFPLIL